MPAITELHARSAPRFPVGAAGDRACLRAAFVDASRARTLGADPSVATCASDPLRFIDRRAARRSGCDEGGAFRRTTAVADRCISDADAARYGRRRDSLSTACV